MPSRTDMGFWSIIDTGQVSHAELAGWLGVTTDTVDDWRAIGLTLQARVLCRSSLGIVDQHIRGCLSRDEELALVDRWRRTQQAGRRCREQIKVALISMVFQRLTTSKSRLARVLHVDNKCIDRYLRDNAETWYVVGLRLADIMRVTMDEMQGQISPERLDETVAHMRALCSDFSTPTQGKEARRGRVKAINLVQALGDVQIDQRQRRQTQAWQIRTCHRCGDRYQVGSATTCADCILGALDDYRVNSNRNQVRIY